METGLTGAIVCITGASGGIGRACADLFAREGARVALFAHRQAPALDEWVKGRDWSSRTMVLSADVRQPRQLETAFERIGREWGCPRVAVVNAGIWPEEDSPLHRLGEERILHTLDVNLLGAIWTARAFLRAVAHHLEPADVDAPERAKGDDAIASPRATAEDAAATPGAAAQDNGISLVLIGSTAGRFGEAGHCDYSVSKAGLYGLLRSLKNEIPRLDPYGRINLVEPGWTDTPMAHEALQDNHAVRRIATTMALRQIARAEDIAAAVLFLASPRLARHISGEVVTVAGGMEGRRLWNDGEIDPELIRRRLET